MQLKQRLLYKPPTTATQCRHSSSQKEQEGAANDNSVLVCTFCDKRGHVEEECRFKKRLLEKLKPPRDSDNSNEKIKILTAHASDSDEWPNYTVPF